MAGTGPEDELHPIVSALSRILGRVAGPLLAATGKVMVGVFIGIYWRRLAAYIFLGASIFALWAAWYNIWGYKIYMPGILRWLCL